MAGSFPCATAWRSLSALLLLCVAGCAHSKANPPAATPKVLYLHTEFLPYKQNADKDLSTRLSREIVRQAMLVAARDGLGVQTCDETLQEIPPEGVEVAHLLLSERSSPNGKWQVRLSKFVEGEGASASAPLWEKTYDFTPATTKIYADMIPKLEADSRGAFIEALQSAGLKPIKNAPKDRKQISPPHDVYALLLLPDFVAQYGAVRAAHQSILENGESPEWLSVLARGYANLASLTHHHWNSATEAFAARAWLYTQRMVAADPKSSFALSNRAYAWALAGSFHDALSDLDQLEKLPADAEASKGDREWTKLIKPFATSDRAGTKIVGAQVKKLKPWSTYLYFELCDIARYPEWMYEAANEVGPVCPTAYKVFDELAHHGEQLGVIRMGAEAAPQAFAHFVPLTLAHVPGLPAEIREVLPADEKKQAELLKSLKDPNPDDSFSPIPTFIAEKLREHSRKNLDGDLSWSALASLVEEEQFVECANYLNVSMNATETPMQAEVDAILPFVKNHRYAPYIEHFALGNVRDPAKLFSLFARMTVRDPRNNMYMMFSRIGYLKDEHGIAIGPALFASSSRNFTLPDIVEYLLPAGPGMVILEPEPATAYANEAKTISPGSPIGARLETQSNASPKLEELEAWEKDANDDSVALLSIAERYKKLGNNNAAVRCWEKSNAVRPSVTTTVDLAQFYRSQDNLKKWEDTLVAFLKTKDLGLQHSVIQEELALGFAGAGEWKKAKPYAMAAAQTYSCLGLRSGSYIAEGLGEWELSEQMAHAAAISYPTSDGADWYFWCRRTGRGDVKSAEKLAAQYFSLPQPHPTEETYVVRGLYDVLTGNIQAGRDDFRQALNIRRTFTNTGIVAQLSRDLKDEQTRKDVIAAMEQEVANPGDGNERNADVDKAGLLLLDLLKNGNPSAERLDKIDEAFLKIDDGHRVSAVAWCYLVGTELESSGHQKDAEKYWRRALIDASRQQILATLAGDKLAKLTGNSRPDKDELTPADLWPPLKAK